MPSSLQDKVFNGDQNKGRSVICVIARPSSGVTNAVDSVERLDSGKVSQ